MNLFPHPSDRPFARTPDRYIAPISSEVADYAFALALHLIEASPALADRTGGPYGLYDLTRRGMGREPIEEVGKYADHHADEESVSAGIVRALNLWQGIARALPSTLAEDAC